MAIFLDKREPITKSHTHYDMLHIQVYLNELEYNWKWFFSPVIQFKKWDSYILENTHIHSVLFLVFISSYFGL